IYEKELPVNLLKDYDRKIDWRIQIALSVITMIGLTFLVYKLNIPNPNLILISGVVLFSTIFGADAGIPAAVIMFIYTLFFFSTGHDFVTFDELNIRKVMVSTVSIILITVFCCMLKRYENLAFDELHYLMQLLKKDNEALAVASLTDTLTSVRNRLALRRDYESYNDTDVHVMMADLDHFKQINDTHGHEEGDKILIRFSKILSETFGLLHCYRYGGDEFLIVLPMMEEKQFNEKLNILKEKTEDVIIANTDEHLKFSAGYVYGHVSSEEDLRNMIRQADERLYDVKFSGKAGIAGKKYEN
ncbi:MAG: GGDEF domain-containing protein, partial [Erysipelotrichaceae bacterium]|nr:GGDEF domain-containing protein [Erysipelotrichaceae bacterium]